MKDCYLYTILIPVIASIINLSFDNATVPASFKGAVLDPILKKDSLDHEVHKNFRPVTKNNNKKNPPLNRPSKYKPPGGLHLENCPKYKVKQSKNGKFTSSNYKASPIDFETQIFLRI